MQHVHMFLSLSCTCISFINPNNLDGLENCIWYVLEGSRVLMNKNDVGADALKTYNVPKQRFCVVEMISLYTL